MSLCRSFLESYKKCITNNGSGHEKCRFFYTQLKGCVSKNEKYDPDKINSDMNKNEYYPDKPPAEHKKSVNSSNEANQVFFKSTSFDEKNVADARKSGMYWDPIKGISVGEGSIKYRIFAPNGETGLHVDLGGGLYYKF